jgi:hypothetical protein
MRRITIPLACAAALSACASLPGAQRDKSGEVLKAINAHIETCERHYEGGLGVGAAFTFRIDCPARQDVAQPEPVGAMIPIPTASPN